MCSLAHLSCRIFIDTISCPVDKTASFRIWKSGGFDATYFEAHKKDALPDERAGIISAMKNDVQKYLENRENISHAKTKMILVAKDLGFNISKLPEEEQCIFMSVLESSQLYKKNPHRGKTWK